MTDGGLPENLPLRRERFKGLYRWHTLWRWMFSTGLAALFLCFVCFVWFNWVKIGNDSMAPTLNRGDLVLVDRIYKYCYEIERTDMVAYRRPDTGELLIKRVVATAGETVSGRNGAVWIDERYRLNEEEYGPSHTKDFDAVTVPDRCVFVLSDDRQYQEDSREADIGCIPLDNVVGVMYIQVLPSFQIYR